MWYSASRNFSKNITGIKELNIILVTFWPGRPPPGGPRWAVGIFLNLMGFHQFPRKRSYSQAGMAYSQAGMAKQGYAGCTPRTNTGINPFPHRPPRAGVTRPVTYEMSPNLTRMSRNLTPESYGILTLSWTHVLAPPDLEKPYIY